ncbi:MAG: SusE domain-containing protein [Flavobacteriaceae bacterium]|nr:SusE domain-containing protein [Flavobacteriaceae bacterium]
MKNIKFLTLLFLSLIALNSCEKDDGITYIAQPVGEFTFSNSFLTEYVLTPTASSNIGERFTWDSANFDIPTNVTYEMQKSISGDFSDLEVVGTTDENSYAITIGELLGFASEAGLDNDPDTENPNTGDVYFRVRAFVGSDSSIENLSATQALTLFLPEDAGSGPACALDQMWAVGAGVPDAGWGWTSPIRFACKGDGLYAGNVNLQNNGGADNNFRFFTTEGDWASGLNYPYYVNEGYTIDANFEDALDDDNNFAFVGTTGFYYLEIDTSAKTITLGEAQSSGECDLEQYYLVGAGVPDAGWGWTTPVNLFCNGDGVYEGPVNLQNNGGVDNNFRFFQIEGDWASGQNFPYFITEGYTIDARFEEADDDDKNFAFIGTSGVYYMKLDAVNKTITLSE